MLQRLNFALTLVSFIGVMVLSVYIFFFQDKLAYVDSAKLISNYQYQTEVYPKIYNELVKMNLEASSAGEVIVFRDGMPSFRAFFTVN